MPGFEKKTGSLTALHLYKIEPPALIEIPAGPFLMGTSDEQILYLLSNQEWAHDWYENDLFLIEQPQFSLELPTFYIAKSPVTNLDYYIFVFKTGYRLPRTWSGFYFPDGCDDHPVTGVCKQDCQAYIDWFSNQTKTQFRLPTEAEWEKAARGGDDRIYPWGNEFDPWRCNTQESGKGETSVVGSYSPSGDSPYGVSDMVGNVWEWTSSQLFPYPYMPDDGREEQNATGKCVVRGGAWYYSKKLARCSAREGFNITNVSASLGFRIVSDTQPVDIKSK